MATFQKKILGILLDSPNKTTITRIQKYNRIFVVILLPNEQKTKTRSRTITNDNISRSQPFGAAP